MIEKNCATEVYAHALAAITELSAAIVAIHGKCSEAEYAQVKKAAGMSIGKIQTDILDLLSADYPELDDLKQRGHG